MPGGRIARVSEWRGQGAAGGMARVQKALKVNRGADVSGHELSRLGRISSGLIHFASKGPQGLWSSPKNFRLPLVPTAILSMAHFFEGVADRVRGALAMAASNVADTWLFSTQMAMAGVPGGGSGLPLVMKTTGGGGAGGEVDPRKSLFEILSETGTPEEFGRVYPKVVSRIYGETLAAEAEALLNIWESNRLDSDPQELARIVAAYILLAPRLNHMKAERDLHSLAVLLEHPGPNVFVMAVAAYVRCASSLGDVESQLRGIRHAYLGESESADLMIHFVTALAETPAEYRPMIETWLQKIADDWGVEEWGGGVVEAAQNALARLSGSATQETDDVEVAGDGSGLPMATDAPEGVVWTDEQLAGLMAEALSSNVNMRAEAMITLAIEIVAGRLSSFLIGENRLSLALVLAEGAVDLALDVSHASREALALTFSRLSKPELSEVTDVLIAYARDPIYQKRLVGLKALRAVVGWLDDPAVFFPVLSEGAIDPNFEIRRISIQALGEQAAAVYGFERHPEINAALRARTRDTQPAIRQVALGALEELSRFSDEAGTKSIAATLRARFSDHDPEVRSLAMTLYGNLVTAGRLTLSELETGKVALASRSTLVARLPGIRTVADELYDLVSRRLAVITSREPTNPL